MEERYVAFDVETPNAQNRRMSAIGVSVIENGQIVQELYTLVDPQTHFDPFNIALTGITPEMVRRQPDFSALCQLLKPYLQNHKLNTLCDHLRLELDHHNAGSDSRACALLLLDYLEKGLRPEPFSRTYRFADRKTLPYCAV